LIYNTIPGTDLRVSKMAVGTMSFGAKLSERDAAEVIACAKENDVDFLDTSHNYNGGESERILGRILTPADRDRFVIASKVGYTIRDGKTVVNLAGNYIVSAVEESLRRLKTDHLDICYFHAPDYNTPPEESLKAMDSLVKAGKVRYLGVSNYAAWQIVDMSWRARNTGWAAPAVTQNVYNMLSRSLETELKPCIATTSMGLVVYNPLAGGLLSGKHHSGQPAAGSRFAGNRMYLDRYWNEENFRTIEQLEKIAAEQGMPLLELALRWCLSQAHVTSILLGMSRPTQFEQNLKIAQAGVLSEAVLDRCDEVWRTAHRSEVNYGR